MTDSLTGKEVSESDRKAWGDYLAEYDWSHFATLTLRSDRLAQLIRREFLRTVDRLATMAQTSIRWFYAVEGIEQPHVHSLLWGTRRLPIEAIEHAWHLGTSRVRIYDSSRGAAWYVCKDLRADSYDMSSRKPPSRKDVSDNNASPRVSISTISGADVT